MGRIDSLLAVVQKKLSKYEKESLRRNGYDKMKETYNLVLSRRNLYKKGDMLKLSSCIEYGKQYVSELEKYKAYYEDLSPIPAFIKDAANPIWDAFHEVGYADDHEVVQKAKQMWQSENEYENSIKYESEVKTWLKEVDGLYMAEPDGVKLILQQAEQDLENPSPELLETIGPYVVGKLRNLEISSNSYATGSPQVIGDADKAVAAFDKYQSMAKGYWDKYESLLPNWECSESQYKTELNKCITNCNQAYKQITSLRNEYNTKLVSKAEQAKAMDNLAKEYLSQIPKNNPAVKNAEASYDEAYNLYLAIMQNCNKMEAAVSKVNYTCEEILPDRYDEEVKPMLDNAKKAFMYLSSHHEPERPTSMVVDFYYEKLQELVGNATADARKVTTYSSNSKTAESSLMSAYQMFNSLYSQYEKQKKNASRSTKLQTLNKCTAQYDLIHKNFESIKKFYENAGQINDNQAAVMDAANKGYTYIQKNADHSSAAYKNSTTLMNKMKTQVRGIGNITSAIKTRYNACGRTVEDVDNKYKTVINEKRSLSSGVRR